MLEKNRVLEELTDASGSTRLAIEKEYQKRINKALLKEGNRMRGKIHVILDRHLVKIDETI